METALAPVPRVTRTVVSWLPLASVPGVAASTGRHLPIMFYLAADNDHDREWVNELAEDVWTNQLPAYRRHEEERPVPAPDDAAVPGGARESWAM